MNFRLDIQGIRALAVMLMYYDESHINHYGSVQYAKYEGDKLAKLIKKLKK